MADRALNSTTELPAQSRSAPTTPWRRTDLALLALLLAATCAAYLPAVRGQFIMDDDSLLWESKIVKASNGLARFWFSADADDYWPMTNSSFWLEWRLWGDNPAGYHVTNLILHIAATLLIWAILQRLAIPGAFLASLIFALHPVNVESIAWISQRKNALAMVFFLLSILWYLRSEEGREARSARRNKTAVVWMWYELSLAAFLLAMLSKGSVAVLPVLLLLLIWWRQQRIGLGDVARTAPFFLVAILLTIVNLWFQTHGIDAVIREASFAQRLAGAGAAVWFYLAKAFLPIELLFVYPAWQIDTSQFRWWLPLLAALVATVVLWRQRASSNAVVVRAVLIAWLFFGVSLMPVLGFTDVGFMKYSLVADHYQHIGIIAVAALVAAAWRTWHDRAQDSQRWMASAAAVVLVFTLMLLTLRQNQYYGEPVALYEATLEKNPTCWMAHNNLGLALVKAKRVPDAIDHYREAVRLKPDFPEALSNWGAALNRMKQPQEAIKRLQEALRMKPDFPLAHNNLGTAYELAGRFPDAIKEFERAIQMDPTFSIAYYNLGYALSGLNRTSDAIASYQEALRLKPNLPEAEYNLALALEAQGRLPEAIDHFQRAIRLKPDAPEMHNSFASTLSNAGRLQGAIAQLQIALAQNPDFAEAHNNLGIALTRADRTPEGIEQFQKALQLKPDFAKAHLNLGVALSKIGQLQDGIKQFEETLRLNPDSVSAYTNLTKAYVLLERPAEALASAEKALELAQAQGKTAEASEITAWIASHRSQQANATSIAPRADSDRPAPRP